MPIPHGKPIYHVRKRQKSPGKRQSQQRRKSPGKRQSQQR